MKKYFSVFILLSSITLIYAQVPKSNEKAVHLQFRFNDFRSDTLTLNVYAQKLGLTRIGVVSYRIPIKSGKGEIGFPIINDLSYIHVESNKWPRLYLDNFLAEPGDQVVVRVDTTGKRSTENISGVGLYVEGRGVSKYEAMLKMNRVQELREKEVNFSRQVQFLKQHNMEERWAYYDSGLASDRDRLLQELNRYEKEVSPFIFATIKADIYYKALESLIGVWGTEWSIARQSPDSTALLEKLKALYQQRFWDEKEKGYTLEEGRRQSWAFLQYMIRKTFSKATMTDPNRFRRWSEAPAYLPFLQMVGQQQFDRLAAGFIAFLVTYGVPSEHPEELLRQVLLEKTVEPYTQLLKNIQEQFFLAKACYPFTLTGMDGKKVSLGDLKGKKLLIDFWFTGCIPCMKLAPRLKELHDKFKSDEAFVVVSICMDQNKELWQASVTSGNYTSQSHLNLYTEGWRTQHPFLQHYGISAVPRLLLVDSKGQLQDSNVPIPFSSEDVSKLADRIKYMP